MKIKLIKILTIVLPLAIYFLISATIFGVTPDVVVNAEIEEINVVHLDDNEYFLYSTNDTTFSGGLVVYRNGVIGTLIDSDDVIKIGYSYYQYQENDDGMFELTKVKLVEIERGYKVPMVIIISLAGVLIVSLIVMGKLDVLKKNPPLSIMISLWTLAIAFIIINTIVSNLMGVFVVAAITSTMYYIEVLIFDGKIDRLKGEKANNDLVETMKRMLNE